MKPHVICHMVSSVDGRTLNSRWRPDGKLASALFERLHDELGGDAWLIGRVTGQEFAKGKPYPAVTDQIFPRENWFTRRDAKVSDVKAYGVALDCNGKIAWGRSDIGGDPIVAVLSRKVSDAHLAGLRNEGVSYIFAGDTELDLGLVLKILNRELGVKPPVAGGRRRGQRSLPARGAGRRTQPGALSSGGRRQGCAERVRFGRTADGADRSRRGDDFGKQHGYRRRRRVVAVPASQPLTQGD